MKLKALYNEGTIPAQLYHACRFSNFNTYEDIVFFLKQGKDVCSLKYFNGEVYKYLVALIARYSPGFAKDYFNQKDLEGILIGETLYEMPISYTVLRSNIHILKEKTKATLDNISDRLSIGKSTIVRVYFEGGFYSAFLKLDGNYLMPSLTLNYDSNEFESLAKALQNTFKEEWDFFRLEHKRLKYIKRSTIGWISLRALDKKNEFVLEPSWRQNEYYTETKIKSNKTEKRIKRIGSHKDTGYPHVMDNSYILNSEEKKIIDLVRRDKISLSEIEKYISERRERKKNNENSVAVRETKPTTITVGHDSTTMERVRSLVDKEEVDTSKKEKDTQMSIIPERKIEVEPVATMVRPHLFTKVVNGSVLKKGFAIPKKFNDIIFQHIGTRPEKDTDSVDIRISMNKKMYDAYITGSGNLHFLYSSYYPSIATELKQIFKTTAKYINERAPAPLYIVETIDVSLSPILGVFHFECHAKSLDDSNNGFTANKKRRGRPPSTSVEKGGASKRKEVSTSTQSSISFLGPDAEFLDYDELKSKLKTYIKENPNEDFINLSAFIFQSECWKGEFLDVQEGLTLKAKEMLINELNLKKIDDNYVEVVR